MSRLEGFRDAIWLSLVVEERAAKACAAFTTGVAEHRQAERHRAETTILGMKQLQRGRYRRHHSPGDSEHVDAIPD